MGGSKLLVLSTTTTSIREELCSGMLQPPRLELHPLLPLLQSPVFPDQPRRQQDHRWQQPRLQLLQATSAAPCAGTCGTTIPRSERSAFRPSRPLPWQCSLCASASADGGSVASGQG